MIRFLILFLVSFTANITLSAQILNRQSYVEYGESYLSQPWQALSRQSFARFKKDGNRVESEGQVFEPIMMRQFRNTASRRLTSLMQNQQHCWHGHVVVWSVR